MGLWTGLRLEIPLRSQQMIRHFSYRQSFPRAASAERVPSATMHGIPCALLDMSHSNFAFSSDCATAGCSSARHSEWSREADNRVR